MLPILHALQEEFGYIDRAAVPLVAEALNLSRAEVHGVVTFYHDFREAPAGRHVLKLCRAEACQSMGCEDAGRPPGPAPRHRLGETTPDGAADARDRLLPGQLRAVPAAMLDGELIGRVDRRTGSTLVIRKAQGRVVMTRSPRVFVPVRLPPPSRSGADAWRTPSRTTRPARGLDVALVRNGSRGMFWLEPLVEVETPDGVRRLRAGDAGRRAAACSTPDFLDGGATRSASARPRRLDWLKRQERLTFARCGVIDPLSLDDYVAHGGFAGLQRALSLAPAADRRRGRQLSGLRGRGGAGFPTGIKWQTVAERAGGPEIHRLQRRRGRQRHLRRPHADGGRSRSASSRA